MDNVKLDGPVAILVTLGLTLPSISDAELDDIRAAAPPGSTVRVAPTMKQAIATAGDADVILGFIPQALFDAAPKLRWVHCIASGMDMFLYPDMKASSVVLTGEKGLVGGHLADTGFGLLLALTRQIAAAVRLGPDGWNHRESMRLLEIELAGLTMGVVGFGGTGRALARRAGAFGMDVIACDVMDVEPSDGVAEVWSMDRLDDLLAASDVVAVGAPLTSETRGLFDDERFAAMKPGALFVNVTRGEIVDGEAIVAALRRGHLGGAALDVAPIEPLPADHPLWTFDNVVMTPHTAGASQLRGPRNIRRFCENLRRAQTGDALLGVVDKELGY
jgi:phosphoglycerate dehydrogenase-like enzyme